MPSRLRKLDVGGSSPFARPEFAPAVPSIHGIVRARAVLRTRRPAHGRVFCRQAAVVAALSIMMVAAVATSAEPEPGVLGIVVLRSWDDTDAQIASEMIIQKRGLPDPRTHGLFVKEVLPGMGCGVLEENDIIIRLANLKLDSEAQWEKARASLVEGQPVKIAFKRVTPAKGGGKEWRTTIVDITPHPALAAKAVVDADLLAREAAKAARERHLSDLRDYVAAFPDSAAEPRYEGPLPVLPDGPKTVGGVEVQSRVGIVRAMIQACPDADIPLSEIAPWVPGVTRSTLRDFMPQETVAVPGELRAILDNTARKNFLTQADRSLMNEAEDEYPGSFQRLLSIIQMMFYLGPRQTETLVREWDDAQRHFFTAADVAASTVRVPLAGGGEEILYWRKDDELWRRFTLASLDRTDIKDLRSKHPANVAKKQREAEKERQRQLEELAKAVGNAAPGESSSTPRLKLWECIYCGKQHWGDHPPVGDNSYCGGYSKVEFPSPTKKHHSWSRKTD